MLQSGRWIATNPGSKIKGYHVNALYSPWVNLHDLVDEFVSVNHNRDKHGLMEFVNLKLGEAWEESNPDADNWEQLFNRRESYPANGVLPDGVLLLTAGIDVQHDRLECTVYGWGVGRRSVGIEHRVLYGRPDDARTWQQLDAVRQRQHSMLNGVRECQDFCVWGGYSRGSPTRLPFVFEMQYARPDAIAGAKVEGPARSAGGSSLAPAIARREAAGALAREV